MNTHLTCTDHISHCISKIYLILRNLWQTCNCLPTNIKLKLVRSLIVPNISYFEMVYCNLDSESKNKLNMALNNTARFIYGKRKYDHISEFTKSILGSNLESYLKIRNILFLYKLIRYRQPCYLYRKLNLVQSSRTHNIIVPRYKTLTASRLFFVSVVRIWNSLPTSIKCITMFGCFKTAVTNILSKILLPYLKIVS